MNLEHLFNGLTAHHYKLTKQRKAILEVLDKYANTVLTAEQLTELTQKIYSETNLSTVYRNLEILEDLGYVYKLMDEDGVFMYKLVCPMKSHHHHLICLKCGKTEAIDFCPLNDLGRILEEKNFSLTDHKLEVYGYCKDCSKG